MKRWQAIVFLVLSVFFWVTLFQSAESKEKQALFAGGCFWCMEADFQKIKGVKQVISGFDGGKKPDPQYREVAEGNTNYVESVKVIYDPDIITYKALLKIYFRNIDPTDSGGQFCDRGAQYRSVIFYRNDKQKQAALAMRQKVKDLLAPKPIHTQIKPSTTFYRASKDHQNYYQQHAVRYHYYRWRCGRDEKLKKIWHNQAL